MDDCHNRIYIKNYKNVKSGDYTHFLTKLYKENRKIKSRKIKGLRPLIVYIIWLKNIVYKLTKLIINKNVINTQKTNRYNADLKDKIKK